jgi:hypothetical protein
MEPASERVALLVIRVWLETDPGSPAFDAAPSLRARLTATHDLADRDAAESVQLASDVDTVCAQVRSWLTGLLHSDIGAT